MNQEIQRSFTLKLMVLTAGLVAVSYGVVKPKSLDAKEVASEYYAQSELIQAGEMVIADYQDSLDESIRSLETVRANLVEDLGERESAQTHSHLQQAAEEFGLTVTRIEPMRAVTSAMPIGDPKESQEVQIQSKEFRIECVGEFSGVVQFFEDLNGGAHHAKVSMFKMIPVSESSVRVIMQVSMLELIDPPASFVKPLGNQSADASDNSPVGDQQ